MEKQSCRKYTMTELRQLANLVGCECILSPRGSYYEHEPYAWLCACGKYFNATVFAIRQGQKCQVCNKKKALGTVRTSRTKRGKSVRAKILKDSPPCARIPSANSAFSRFVATGELTLDKRDLSAVNILKTLKTPSVRK